VALAAATATGVVLGTRFAAPAAWVAASLCLAVACLGAGVPPRLRARSGPGASTGGPGAAAGGPRVGAGVLVLGVLVASGAAVASVRAAAVSSGVLVGRIGQPGRVEVVATVAEEPRRLRFGGHWVVLSVHRVHLGGRSIRTRERAGVVLPRAGILPPRPTGGPPGTEPTGPGRAAPDPTGGPAQRSLRGPGQPSDASRAGGEARVAVGDRLRVRGSVVAARWSDRLARQPPVVLRHPVVEDWAQARAPPLRVSELVRVAARMRALDSLPPDRAGLLVGMALGDTSLLPADLERDFRAAGLTHLMAVSGANLAVVLAAGLWLAAVAGAGRRVLAVVGIALVVVLVIVTRWEPSVLRAGVMAGLVLLGVASGRGPGGRRALCLAVVVLLLADPGLAGAVGFQLSVAATAGVLWVGPVVARSLPGRLPERVRTAVGMTLGAQATAVPALALALGPVSLAGLPANLVGLPLAGGPMLLGVVAAATAPAAPWVATLACRLADPFLLALLAVARWAAGLPGGTITLSGPARLVPAAVAALVLVAVALRRRPPYLPDAATLPIDLERTALGDDHRRRAPPGGAVAAGGRGARDLGAPDLQGPGQDVRHPLRRRPARQRQGDQAGAGRPGRRRP
jgi:competence protein ComEC